MSTFKYHHPAIIKVAIKEGDKRWGDANGDYLSDKPTAADYREELAEMQRVYEVVASNPDMAEQVAVIAYFEDAWQYGLTQKGTRLIQSGETDARIVLRSLWIRYRNLLVAERESAIEEREDAELAAAAGGEGVIQQASKYLPRPATPPKDFENDKEPWMDNHHIKN